jgi:hypothetical protein
VSRLVAIAVMVFVLIPAGASEPASMPPPAIATALPPEASAHPSETSGLLHLRVKHRPGEKASSIRVTVKNIQVQKAGAPEGSDWFTIIKEPKTFDLVGVEQGEEVLGGKMLAEGMYSRVQLDLVSVKVTLKGQEKPAKVVIGRLKEVRPFDIDMTSVIILTLDFDAAKSLVFVEGGEIQFRPVVRLLVRREPPG